jgi:hypothetical protein
MTVDDEEVSQQHQGKPRQTATVFESVGTFVAIQLQAQPWD